MSSNADVSFVITLRDGTKRSIAVDEVGSRVRQLLQAGHAGLDSPTVRMQSNGQCSSRALAGFFKWASSDGSGIKGSEIETAVRNGRLSREDVLQSAVGEFPAEEIIRAMRRSSLRPADQVVVRETAADTIDDAEPASEVGLPPIDELDDADRYLRDDDSDESADPEPAGTGHSAPEAETGRDSRSDSPGEEVSEEPRWQELESRLRSLEETIVESTGSLQECLESVQTQTADGTSTLSRRIGRSMLIALLGSVLVGAIAVGSYLLIPTVRAEENGQPQVPVAGTPDLREDLRKVKAGVDDVRAEHHRSRELINRLLDMRLSEIIQDAAAKNSARNEELLAPLSARLDTLQKSLAGLSSADNVAAVDQRLKNLAAELKALTGKEGELEQMQSALAELASQKSVSQIAADLRQISTAAEQLHQRQQAVDDQLTLIAGSLKIPTASGLSNVIVLFDAGEAMGELDYKPAREALVTAVSESIRHTGERSLGVLWNRGDQRPIQLVNFAPHTDDEARSHADRIRGEVISSGADHQWSIGLSDALERISTAPPNQPRRIVYITTPPERPEENVSLRLRQLIADARQVKAEIWIMQLSGAETSPQTDLWQLAARTGGKFLLLNAEAGSPAKLRSQVAAELHQALSLPAPRGE